MCGLAGFLGGEAVDGGYDALLRRMTDRLVHRGPDDHGHWYDARHRIGLGHRRLSIVELSAAGHQPMTSHGGRYVLAFNGEIYNHLQLRQDLQQAGGCSEGWRGRSDTETLLAAFEHWGIEQTLQKLVGMFAIALWDCRERVLTLARDRLGEKPLYYGFQSIGSQRKTLLFGSELKALAAHPGFAAEIDRDVLCLYLRHSCIPAPYSIYKGISKLTAGTYLQFRLDDNNALLPAAAPTAYWSLAAAAEQGLAAPFEGGDAEAIAALHEQLRQSVRLQMVADVPLGAFLSGGVDSSTVVALMQAQSAVPIKTFSIGFAEQGFNEAEYAAAVARHLGTDHTELYVTAEQAIEVVPRLGQVYDEPFADSSQIPTFLVAQLARQQVTVSLSGDGGDELFCGYNSYRQAHRWERIARIPFGLRRLAGRLGRSVPPAAWNTLLAPLGNDIGQRVHNLAARLMSVNGSGELFYSLDSVIAEPQVAVPGASEPASWLTAVGMRSAFADAPLHMMFMSTMTYLPDDILTKVDRAAMAHSLETRMPLLDHRLVELAYRLPMSLKLRGGQGKWILRQVLDQYVPRNLIERPKVGFSIPLALWLRGVLREWAESLLDERRLQQEGFFNVAYVRQQWQRHLAGVQDHAPFLWNVLMFQVWLEQRSMQR
jgi:asparagine synthase (glutamine-hydrolysing)